MGGGEGRGGGGEERGRSMGGGGMREFHYVAMVTPLALSGAFLCTASEGDSTE